MVCMEALTNTMTATVCNKSLFHSSSLTYDVYMSYIFCFSIQQNSFNIQIRLQQRLNVNTARKMCLTKINIKLFSFIW
jgi:hypothetical protein